MSAPRPYPIRALRYAASPQFLRYAIAGAAGTAVHYLVLIALVQGASVAAVPASTAGAVAGALVNYRLNHRYTFESDRSHATAAVLGGVPGALATRDAVYARGPCRSKGPSPMLRLEPIRPVRSALHDSPPAKCPDRRRTASVARPCLTRSLG